MNQSFFLFTLQYIVTDSGVDLPKGCINYSVSTFGFMDYQQKTSFILKTFESDEYGCNYNGALMHEEQKQHGSHIAYLFKRGKCTYVEKALNVRKAGGALALVYLNSEEQQVDEIIPIAPKSVADNVPPVAVINNARGQDLIKGLKENDTVRLKVDYIRYLLLS